MQSRNVVDLQDEVDDAETGYTAKDLNVLQQNFTQNLSLFFVKMSAQHLIPDNTVSTMAHELQNIVEWSGVSSFLTAHQHIKGYFVPSRLLCM